MNISKKLLIKIIKESLKYGEIWGCAYSGWFEPTTKQKIKYRQKSIIKVLNLVKKELKKDKEVLV